MPLDPNRWTLKVQEAFTSAGHTSKRSLARAVELLRQVDAPLVGTVLNSLSPDDSFSGEPYRYETTSSARRQQERQPEPATNGGRRRRSRWGDDEGDPDAEWDAPRSRN